MARGVVVITGASSGIGEACVRRLAAHGFRVFAGVRRPEAAETWRGEPKVMPVRIDLADDQSIAAAAREIQDALNGERLAGLVNNAGIAVAGPLEYLPMERFRHQLEVNLVGHLAITQALLAALRAARGRIVNIGSVGGRVALPMLSAYDASKWALEGATDSLRRELRGFGVHVAIVEPGAVDTAIWGRAVEAADELVGQVPPEARELYGGLERAARREVEQSQRRAIPPDRVARAVHHALTARRPRTRYLVGGEARMMVTLSRLLGDRGLDALIARRMRG
jgi:NAD(P)-dependent dehydrogenase (short-subunit alcohol dehydrogenase family)